MQFKIFSRRIAVLTIFICVIFILVLISYRYFDYKKLAQVESNVPVVDASIIMIEGQTHSGLPLRIKIPKINLDAKIEYVGLAQNGEMATPKSTSNVGWYELGVRPGEQGSAVIAGHYGWKEGRASAFDELHKLHIGDKFYIEDDTGTVTSFVVRANRRYDPEDDTLSIFTSTDGEAHLNLITCEGDWDPVTKSYSKRLVVFADKE